MSTIVSPAVSSKNIKTVSLWKIEKPNLKIVRTDKKPTRADVSALRQKISMAALLIRDRRFPSSRIEQERITWQQAYDSLLVALQMLNQAELTPRHANYCICQAESLFDVANKLAAFVAIEDRPIHHSEECMG